MNFSGMLSKFRVEVVSTNLI